MPLSSVLQKHLADYTVEIDNGESVVGTRVIQNAKTSETKSLAIFQLTFQDLRQAPEGQWTSSDVKIYEVGAATIPAESVVKNFGGDDFRVMEISDRNKDGGFTMYWARRIGDNETDTE